MPRAKLLLPLALFVALTSGCTRRTYGTLYGERLPPRNDYAKVDVYNINQPTRPFKEIGEVEVRSNGPKSIKKILLMARRMGGDAVILTGDAGTRSEAYAVTDRAIVGRSHSYGKRAVVIVYTD